MLKCDTAELMYGCKVVVRRRFWHATLRSRSTIRRHYLPQRAVLSQICCFRERKVMVFQILLDNAEPRDVGTTWLSSPVCQRGG